MRNQVKMYIIESLAAEEGDPVATVKAYPRKQFFIDMFTRDITLEDCILDLIDNSMDSYLRTRKIDVGAEVFGESDGVAPPHPGLIQIDFSPDQFTIRDDCGGIDRKAAEDEVFCFGHGKATKPSGGLGVYGIGLKRAIFKLGNLTVIESSTPEGGFTVRIDVATWSKDEDDLAADWTFPIEDRPERVTQWGAGTRITITGLHDEVKVRMSDGALEGTLRRIVAQTYGVFLGDHVSVRLNGVPIERTSLPLGGSAEIEPGFETFAEGGVTCTLLATLAPRAVRRLESAGWYVICNGRIVLAADKSEVTGWGAAVLPTFQPKFRPFVGVALFMAEDPSLLPWTTSKRGLNRESILFQKVRGRMAGIAKPVLTFLNELYPSRSDDDSDDDDSGDGMTSASRAVAESVTPADFRTLMKGPVSSTFAVRSQPVRKTTTRVQYDAEFRDLNRIRRRLRRPSLAASSVGRYTFDHFLKTECPE
jgi:hypothetical protein